MSKPKLIIFFIVILLLVIVILQNPDAVTLRFFWWKIEMSLFVIPIVIIVSIGIGFFIASVRTSRRKKKGLE